MPSDQHARKFRVDIEGLRGVAVCLVVLYHAGVTWLSGGYVGVDVFFVISGFLITGLLVQELRERGTVSLRNFYARRVRRLLPAGMFVLIVTLIVAKIVAPPLYMTDLSGDAKATALYASNIRFAITSTEYLRQGDAPSALLHYWSLAVEEQFYLVWPLLLLLAYRLFKSIRAVAGAIGILAIVSLILCVRVTLTSQPWAFFSLPTRAWELGAGAGVALGAAWLARLPRPVLLALGWAGLLAIGAAAVLLDDGTAFPGWAATLPVLGSAGLIAAGISPKGQGAPQKVLAFPPLVAFGRISYSLYLWHWPVLILPAIAAAAPLSAPARAGLVVLSVILATLSFRFVEKPFRTRPSLVKSPKRSFAMAGSLTTIALVGAFLVSIQPSLSAGKPAPAPTKGARTIASAPVAKYVPSDLQPSLADAKKDLPLVYEDGCHLRFKDTVSPNCVYGPADAAHSIVLYGDSHAAQWFPAMEKIALDRGWKLISLTKSACPAVDVPITLQGADYAACYPWRDSSIARINQEDPDLIVISDSRSYGVSTEEWAAGIKRTIGRLPAGAQVVLLSDSPNAATDPPTCLSAHLHDPAACATPRKRAVSKKNIKAEKDAAESAGADFIDTTDWVCPHDPCQVVIWNYLVMRDIYHITATYAEYLTPELEKALAPELKKAAAG
jgi:peptidoglycan/LPS O-acetylase OafA/YrhL